MKKIILTILILAVIFISAAVVYLNNVVLPVKVKSMIQKSIEDASGKSVSMGQVRISLISGLVLRDISIGDEASTMISIKEVSLRPFILPFLKKEFIVPVIRIKSPTINLERRPDGTFNIADLFKNYSSKTGEFRVIIRRINIKDGRGSFTDNTFAEPFKKDINGLSADIRILLPSKIRFEADCDIPGGLSTIIGLWGEYSISDGSVTAKITLTDASPGEFAPYYKCLNIDLHGGKADALLNLKYGKSVLTADIDIRAKETVFVKNDISAKFSSDIKADGSYDFTNKELKYSGDMSVQNMEIDGIKSLGKIESLRAEVKFTESSFYAKDVKAVVFGMPFSAEAYIPDYKASLFIADIVSELSLGALKETLKDKFNISVPADIRGSGRLYIKWEADLKETGSIPEINGYLDMEKATVVFNKEKPPLEVAFGQIQFSSKQLTWQDLEVKYRETLYNTSGTLTNFEAPGVQISLNSRDLTLKITAALSGNTVTISKFAGKYINTDFSITGDLDMSDPSGIRGEINGTAETSIDEIKNIMKGSKDKLEKMKLSGALKADFRLAGKISDVRSCAIDAKIFSNTISIYDLKPVDVVIDYNQREGVGNITRFHSFLYGGTVTASGRMDLNSAGLPYFMNADIAGVKIEGLKTATAFKDKDISGTLSCQAHLEGLYKDLSKSIGSGKIAINNGKLWQLNLFQGLGKIIFPQDISNVVFSDGNCSFSIKEQSIYTDDLVLKSDLLNIYGSVKMSFDKYIDASLKSEFTDEALRSGSISTAADQIGKNSYITIKGSLKDPKYTVRPDVPNIVKGIAEQIFNN
ncbi:MAG: AsmA family protein [Candidatus Omnitrophica bacterium]|nr:AsmA family protein [Candidatus Omnitrophota bacterium]